jgi:hypothetical protein
VERVDGAGALRDAIAERRIDGAGHRGDGGSDAGRARHRLHGTRMRRRRQGGAGADP